MKLRSLLSLALRDSRGAGARWLYFVICLAVGVAAVTTVASLAAALEATIRRDARPLLAADIVIEGQRPVPAVAREILAAGLPPNTVRFAEIRELATLIAVSAPPEGATESKTETSDTASPRPTSQLTSILIELKVVDGAYPFYGQLELEPSLPLQELLARGVVVGPDLLRRMNLAIGDRVRVGSLELPIVAQVVAEPDRLGASFGLSAGPRVFIGKESFATTGLEALGSRIRYRLLAALPDDAPIPQVSKALRQDLPDAAYFRVETYDDAQPALRRGIERVEKFLGLIALLALLVGGIGVAQAVRAWLTERLDAIAALKCLGLRPRAVLGLYLVQTIALGAVGSAVGIAIAIIVQLLLPQWTGGLLPPEAIDPWRLAPILRGLGLGIGVALLFALPPLTEALRIPPVRVLRRDAEPIPMGRGTRILSTLTLLGGVFGAAWLQAGSAANALGFTAILTVTAAALAILAAGLRRLARQFLHRSRGDSVPAREPSSSASLENDLANTRRSFPVLRYGLTSFARPGGNTLPAIVALGLGVLIVLVTSLVERRVVGELSAGLPKDAPSSFFVDVQPDQWPKLEAMLQEANAESVASVAVVTARLTAVDGVPILDRATVETDENSLDEENERWALTREQRLTYLDALPDDNEIVEGCLWCDPTVDEVSVEVEFAASLGASIGSKLSFDLQGVPLELVVTSLRTVDWSTFGINFFLVAEPIALENAPQMRVAAAHLPKGRDETFQDELARSLPNVTMLQIREILEKISGILEKIARGVGALGLFTVIAGIAILAGAVSASSAQRGREVAILKTLGLRRRSILSAFAIEFLLVGSAAACLGVLGAIALSSLILEKIFELPWAWDPMPLILTLVATSILTVVAALTASIRALQQRPSEVLRR